MQGWTAVVAALTALLACGPVVAQESGPSLDYVTDLHGNVRGGFRRDVTAVHQATAAYTALFSEGWSATGAVTGTFGTDLSEVAIGDAQGVQGASAGGDALWLYQAYVTRSFEGGEVSVGRLSSGDAFGSVGTMEDQFVNSAFSSNGGAISLNGGRLPAPASSWGVLVEARPGERVMIRSGTFLSDQARANADRSADLSFRPDDGVLGFAEAAVASASGRWEAGLGGWADSARFDAFHGERERGNVGGYAWVAGRLAGAVEGRRVEGFAMLQVAPREDRSLQPLAVQAGVSAFGWLSGRPDDVANLAVASGVFSDDSGLDGAETILEANYALQLNEAVVVRPDLQLILNPGGRFRDAVVLGVQLELGL